MSQWTYHVKISTEAGSSISNAVRDLSTAQEVAKTQFDEMIEVLAGEKFADTVLKALTEHLKDYDKEQDQERFEKYFAPIIHSVREIQAGIITLMDLKEGNFSNVLNTFRLASKSILDNKGIEDAILTLFRKTYGETDENKENLINEVLDFFSQITPTAEEIGSEKYIEDPKGITNKLLLKPIGTIDERLDEFEGFLSNFIINEFTKFMDTISENSGKETFEKILGDKSKEDLFILKQAMKGFLKGTTTFRYLQENIVGGETLGIPEEKVGKNPFEAIGSENWDNLVDSFKDGIMESIEKGGSSVLKDETSLSIVGAFIDDIFEKALEQIIERISMPGRKRIPNIETTVHNIIKTEDIYDPENLKNSLKMYIEASNDPFNLESLREQIPDILAKSHIEASEGENVLEDMQGILRKNLQEAGAEDILSIPLAEFMTNYLKDQPFEVRKDITEAFENLVNKIDEIFLTEKINTEVDTLFHNLENMLDELEEDDEENIDNKLKPDFQQYFSDAIDDRDDLKALLQYIHQALSDENTSNTGKLDSRIGRAINLISAIDTTPQEQPASTVSQIRRSAAS